MNADQAKELHLPAIIEAAGGQRDEQKSSEAETWFKSPFRDEKTASLKATRGNNGRWMWTDYGTGKGGNVIAFANVVLGKQPDDRAISEALKWLRGLSALQSIELPARPRTATPAKTPPPDRYRMVSRKQVHHARNLQYIGARGINKATAALYLEQVTFTDTKAERDLYGLGMENEADGIEITTATAKPFKTCIGPKSFSQVEGVWPDARTHVFEGMFDFLTYLTLHGIERPRGRCYVMHSVAMTDRVIEAIKKQDDGSTVVLWLDNDAAGKEAAQRIFEGLAGEREPVATMNHLYEGFKDLNEWYVATRPGKIEQAQPKQFHDTAWNTLQNSRKPQPN
jgi:DNA primase